MSQRHVVLTSVLSIALAVFAWYLVEKRGAETGEVVGVAVLYLAAAVLLLRRFGGTDRSSKGEDPGLIQKWIAAYAIGGAALLLLLVATTPIFGFQAFEVFGTVWFPVMLVGAVVSAYPWASRMLT